MHVSDAHDGACVPPRHVSHTFRSALALVPFGHGVHPMGGVPNVTSPGSQPVQVSDASPEYVPAAHGSHRFNLAFARVPFTHGSHPEAPAPWVTYPSGQALHCVAPSPEYRPAGHSSHWFNSALAFVPLGQREHELVEEYEGELLCVYA